MDMLYILKENKHHYRQGKTSGIILALEQGTAIKLTGNPHSVLLFLTAVINILLL